MKKKWWLIGLATLAIAGGLAVAIPALQPPRPGVTKANFDRIEDGMTEDEVTAIFGCEPRTCLTIAGARLVMWEGADGARAGAIIIKEAVDGGASWTPSTETITDKLRRWLSLPRK